MNCNRTSNSFDILRNLKNPVTILNSVFLRLSTFISKVELKFNLVKYWNNCMKKKIVLGHW